MNRRLGAFAVLGLVCGIVAFFMDPVAGILLAVLAIIFGILGFFRSVSPRVSGGVMSLLAIVIGAIGVVVKILHGALALIF